ncbi:MAG: DUF5113 domain-containing protein [Bacteroidaceae bacterium]|nr:DUF5113 domain-containing protein [Bacteroidaceae bacterium]
MISILFFTLCSVSTWAQGKVFSYNEEMLNKSREMFDKSDYDSALYYINKAELSKGKILDNPQLAADIHEQYSLIFSALNNKQQSDYHRNMYLDVREQARRDHFLEKKAAELQGKTQWLSIKITLLVVAIVTLLIVYLFFKEKFSVDENTGEKILKKRDYDAQEESLQEQLELLNHKLGTNKEQNIDKQTKLFLVSAVSPLIARLRHAIDRPSGDKSYVFEILSEIDRYNVLLTDWISLEQGKLSFKIETFPVSDLFNILKRNEKTFALQGITLQVKDCDMMVKADKVLTLFMLNTLADNARKATATGGRIEIYAECKDEYLELSVKDSGKGMTEEQAASIFTHSITDGHGFGLLNCRGIINSYKKVGSMFNCCMIGVESKLGEGTRFFFRLPLASRGASVRGGVVTTAIVAMLLGCMFCQARPTRYTERITDTALRRAADYADSAYYSNIDGNYKRTLLYADSARLSMIDVQSGDMLIDDITVDISNEAAVAALALHRWDKYRDYNSVYEAFYDKLTSNRQLEDYCKRQTTFLSHMKIVWTVSNCCFFVLLFLSVIYIRLLWLRRRRLMEYRDAKGIDEKKSLVRQMEYENESLHISNNILANGLSTIKHETMYYPSRIEALLKENASQEDISELTTFYEQLYSSLLELLTKQKLASGIKITSVKLTPTDGGQSVTVKADKELYAYMLRLIKKFLNAKRLSVKCSVSGMYVDVCFSDSNKTDKVVNADCFLPRIENIPMLVCRQIMREMSYKASHGNGVVVRDNSVVLRFSSATSN